MSRSRRKTPIIGITTAESEKTFKAIEHRRERRTVNSVIGIEPETLPDPKAYGDPWAGPKDGRQYLRRPTDKLMRK